jgi:hypothetical protein
VDIESASVTEDPSSNPSRFYGKQNNIVMRVTMTYVHFKEFLLILPIVEKFGHCSQGTMNVNHLKTHIRLRLWPWWHRSSRLPGLLKIGHMRELSSLYWTSNNNVMSSFCSLVQWPSRQSMEKKMFLSMLLCYKQYVCTVFEKSKIFKLSNLVKIRCHQSMYFFI